MPVPVLYAATPTDEARRARAEALEARRVLAALAAKAALDDWIPYGDRPSGTILRKGRPDRRVGRVGRSLVPGRGMRWVVPAGN